LWSSIARSKKTIIMSRCKTTRREGKNGIIWLLNTEAECSEFLLTFINLAPDTLFKSVLQLQSLQKTFNYFANHWFFVLNFWRQSSMGELNPNPNRALPIVA
jgi:hypothetical protein